MSESNPLGAAKQAALVKLMAEAGVREDELEEKFIRASGPGGQKVNKTSSAVWLRHVPSGREVKVQTARSQRLNRYHARQRLCEAILNERLGLKSKAQQEAEKVRRQKRRRSRRGRARDVDDKRVQGAKKAARRLPSDGEH